LKRLSIPRLKRIAVLKMVQQAATAQYNRQTRFLLLLISLLALMVLEPFLYDRIGIRFLLEIFFSVILFSCIFAVSVKRGATLIALLLALPKLGTTWAISFITPPLLFLFDSILGFIFFAYIIALILHHIFRQKDVSLETIYGAIVVYILIGIMWVFLYHLTEFIHPNSFSMAADLATESRKALFYYSFVTLTTLGYGDITPISHPAKSLAMLEAIVGQMYIAVLIARLVGMHISQGLLKK
jgi:cellulose synthase/poly-beta-1,6-N-acetylglucosamine synthase-like glycosyltransferase